jgi:predicted transcriptional regulator
MDEETRRAIESLARKSGKTRNALINEAVREFVRNRAVREWPENVKAWLTSGKRRNTVSLPPFESYRTELAEQREPSI